MVSIAGAQPPAQPLPTPRIEPILPPSSATPSLLGPACEQGLRLALALLLLIPLVIAYVDRPLAQLLQDRAAFLVAPSQAVTDALSLAVLPQWPKWAHPLAIALIALILGLSPGGVRWRRLLLLSAATLLATRLSVAWLKPLLGRVRPHDYLADPGLADFFVAGRDSFPSGHTAVYMGLLLPAALLLPRWRWPLLISASLLALARVTEGKHYLGDIMASSLIALLYLLLFSWLFSRLSPRFSRPASAGEHGD